MSKTSEVSVANWIAYVQITPNTLALSCYRLKKFQASITLNQKRYHLGYFTDEIDAAKAYDKKAKELFGEYAYLNFPEGF